MRHDWIAADKLCRSVIMALRIKLYKNKVEIRFENLFKDE